MIKYLKQQDTRHTQLNAVVRVWKLHKTFPDVIRHVNVNKRLQGIDVI